MKKRRRRVRKSVIFVIVVLLLIIALLISMIAKKVSDKEVSEPKQEKTTETKKENKEFLTKDYANNSTVAFKRANEYGLTSSQEFKVQPIIKKDKTIGYECIFKGSE